ncbi:MAG: sensor histidine kinase, partial [Saprospiraceae bacterium]
LEIQGKSPDSSWSESLMLPFLIQSPIWKQWWFYALLTLGILSFSGIIASTIRKRERNRILLNRRFAEAELKALQAQMSPHFIFNTLNAIQYTILKQDLQLAGRSLNDFASLMRLFLESSQQKQVSLDDEIKMLRHYCELTRMCYEGKFDFNIKVDPQIEMEDISIPGMLLQPHLENAIQHGLLPKNNKGWLTIQFDMADKETLRCIIRDDGIGRTASAKRKENSNRLHQSRGMILTQDRAAILNEVYDADIDIEIKDLKNKNGNALGTDVIILIAVN